MHEGQARKLRSEDTWAEVRRAWEQGATGASLARRYDVGLANLWRRRASEGWRRPETDDPVPEPVEGWDRYARRELDAFERRLEEARAVALDLVRAMQGGPLDSAPLWHVGFLLRYRAEHLGVEVAARDRAHAQDQPWADAAWTAEGRLRPLSVIDHELLRLHRDAWREEVGLPKGAAESWP